MITDSLSKVEILNSQFKSVFTPQSGNTFPQLPGTQFPKIKHLHISENGVFMLLDRIDVSKSSGPDKLPGRLLQSLAKEITPIVHFIFTQSLCTGELPTEWTQANVAPIFKKGSKLQAVNYRPVSLTCITCKLFEHIICKHILAHLEDHKILTDLQHGFRSGRSCETQLVTTFQDLAQMHNKKGRIYNFLKDRKQSVVVDGKQSSLIDVVSGVPQGTVLGPLLFLLHINDLPSVVSSKVRLFADDCLIYRNIKNKEDQIALQKDLNLLENWGNTWGMHFNAAKCNIMRVSRTRDHKLFNYSLTGQVLEEVMDAKYLGVTLSNDLEWSKHIATMTNKASSKLSFLRHNLKGCPEKLKQTAYFSLIHSFMEYGATVWDPYQKYNSDKIERMQRQAARFVKSRYLRYYSVSDMLDVLGWTPLSQRRQEARLILFYKIINSLAQVPFEGVLVEAYKGTRRKQHEI